MLKAKLAQTLHIFYDVTTQTELRSRVHLTSKPRVVIVGSDIPYFHPFPTQRGQHQPLPEKITTVVAETGHAARYRLRSTKPTCVSRELLPTRIPLSRAPLRSDWLSINTHMQSGRLLDNSELVHVAIVTVKYDGRLKQKMYID